MEKIEIIKVIIAACVAAWEIGSRLIPTESRWSIIGKILEIAQKISDVFDRNEKKKK